MKIRRRLEEPSTWLGILIAVLGVIFGTDATGIATPEAGIGAGMVAGGIAAALKKDPGSPE